MSCFGCCEDDDMHKTVGNGAYPTTHTAGSNLEHYQRLSEVQPPKVLAMSLWLEIMVKYYWHLGSFARIVGMIDFLSGLGKRMQSNSVFLSFGFLSQYGKVVVITVGEEIASMALPSTICPLVFVFTSSGNVAEYYAHPENCRPFPRKYNPIHVCNRQSIVCIGKKGLFDI
ncbi:hypothetical protein CASFOL_028373 [Castilleja foliolosa]|uniref:Uncharacterized protein n=1 Tax=Castilleja foliolosa TaxID=1961234 RepID=A0ABD3CDZ3_9LAMI